VNAVGDGRRAATKAANRAAILDAGREVFSELGYGAASVRDIVRRTPLASGTFYNYFPDKASVFRALVEDVAAEARRRARAARRDASTLRGFVEDAYRAFFAFMVEDPATLAFVARNLGTIREHFGEAVMPAGVTELREDLEAGIASGALPPVDLDYCAHAMIAVALELGQRLLQRDPPDVEGATAFASALFVGGLEEMVPRSALGLRGTGGQMIDPASAAPAERRKASSHT
jgi:AcrR family transcriptional regulator